MTNSTNNAPKRTRRLEWVNALDLQVNPVAQREFRPAWAATILAEWDLEKFQEPHVNKRADGSLYIMEGQHGTDAYKKKYGEDGQDYLPIQVWLYEGLDETAEADFFLGFNNKKAIDAMSKFKVGVTAKRAAEVEIDRIVRAHGCYVGNTGGRPNSIQAISALQSIYRSHGTRVLSDTIAALHASFGGEGAFERPCLLGVSNVIARYGVPLDRMVKALASIRNGSKGLIQATNRIREAMGCTIPDAAAAAVVEAYNKSFRGRHSLASWFSIEDAA